MRFGAERYVFSSKHSATAFSGGSDHVPELAAELLVPRELAPGGWSPCSRQVRATLDGAMPTLAASVRVLQRCAPGGAMSLT